MQQREVQQPLLISSALHMALGLAEPDLLAAEQIESVSAVRAVRQAGRWNAREDCLGGMMHSFSVRMLMASQISTREFNASETATPGNLGKV